MSQIAVYRRVSTTQQDTQSQEHAVTKWLTDKGYSDVTVFEDVGISGKTEKRPGYQALCTAIERGEIDTVVVYRLDRLSRNAVAAMRVLIDWCNRGVSFYAVDQPILQLGADNPFRLTFLALMAEIAQVERETTVARIKAGLDAARARGKRLGAKPQVSDRMKEQIRAARPSSSYQQLAKKFKLSTATIHKICKSEGQP